MLAPEDSLNQQQIRINRLCLSITLQLDSDLCLIWQPPICIISSAHIFFNCFQSTTNRLLIQRVRLQMNFMQYQQLLKPKPRGFQLKLLAQSDISWEVMDIHHIAVLDDFTLTNSSILLGKEIIICFFSKLSNTS
jgi:hypothetical protein